MSLNTENRHDSMNNTFMDSFSFINNYFNKTHPTLDANENFYGFPKQRLSLSPIKPARGQFYNSKRHSLSPIKSDHSSIYELTNNFEDEPPLLDELEIYPERIIGKSLLIMNPFHTVSTDEKFLADVDVTGPILFSLMYGCSLFLARKSVGFGYVYGFSMISVLGMYLLLKIMCCNPHGDFITLTGIASALGYGISPVLCLSILSIFINLNTIIGYLLAAVSIGFATLGASRMMCWMTLQKDLYILIAYPTALIYTAFSLLTLF